MPGLAYVGTASSRRSIQDFDQAIQLDGSFAKASSIAAIAIRARTATIARSPVTAPAIELNPKDACSRYSRGLTMRAVGQEAEAAVEIPKAKEIEPGIGPGPGRY